MPRIISLQVGEPQERVSDIADGQETVWTSSIAKHIVEGRLPLGRLGLPGDRQADTKHHGGADKAVCCYCEEHYAVRRNALGLDAVQFPFGAFGENFTVSGLPEEETCVGDIFRLGTALVQVSQPRQPCWKLGRRWHVPSLPGDLIQSGQTGYYLRVLEHGEVGPGDAWILAERPLPHWTITRLNEAMYRRKDDAALAEELGRLPLLAEAWRSNFRRRAGLIRYQASRR